MVTITCPTCLGRYSPASPISRVKTGETVLEFSCDTCKGMGRVDKLPNGEIQAIEEKVRAMMDSRNKFYTDHPEVFQPRRKK